MPVCSIRSGPLLIAMMISLPNTSRPILPRPLILSRYFFHFSRSLPGRKWIINLTSGARPIPLSWMVGLLRQQSRLRYGHPYHGHGIFSNRSALFRPVPLLQAHWTPGCRKKSVIAAGNKFEQIDKFVRLKKTGALTPPAHAASTIIRLLPGRKTGERRAVRFEKSRLIFYS